MWSDSNDLVTTKDNELVFQNDPLKTLWQKSYNDEKGWVTESEFNNLKNSYLEYVAGIEKDTNLNIQHETSALVGKLWDHTKPVNIEINSFDNTVSKSYSRSEINSSKELNQSLKIIFGKKKKYGYVTDSVVHEYLDNILNLKEVPVM